MRGLQAVIELSGEERDELARWASSRTLPAGDVFKARLILALADGVSYSRIEAELGTSRPTIARWKGRFERDRIGGLEARHKGSRPRKATPTAQARVLRKTQGKPGDGSTQWTCSKMADATGLSRSTVQRIWAKTGLKPHRLDRYMASSDPQFEEKAADVIGLYLNPPQHAAVFCVDEKTAIQALDRLDPVLPLSPGRAERHGFEYYRHGTLSLYAALDVQTGKVHGKTAKRHTSEDCLRVRRGGPYSGSARDPYRPRQPVSPQNPGSERFSERKPARSLPLHPNIFVMAQPGRNLVCPHPARRDLTRRLHFRLGSVQKADEVHPGVRQIGQAVSLDLLQSCSSHRGYQMTGMVQ
jgi:transposase